MYETEGSKYHPLFEHLLFSGQRQLTLSFGEIEAVIGAPLPASAGSRQEWWSNSPNGHSQARAWMRAGYESSRVDLIGRRVTFTLAKWPDRMVSPSSHSPGLAEPSQALLEPHEELQAERDHPLFGIWTGKVKLIPGYDYTRPAFEPGGDLDA
jgi:hypothetical protein